MARSCASPPSLTGKIGESPFSVGAQNTRFDMQSRAFGLAGLDARIGGGANPVLLHAGMLDGALGDGGKLSGTLADGTAVIGTVPLNLGSIVGTWQFADGALALNGVLRVTDQQKEARFYPLLVEGAKLTLANSRIEATGALVATGDPKKPIREPFARVVIGHDLGTGAGQADFNLDKLRFGKAIQPKDLSQSAEGIVENVEGLVEGSGVIRWSADGVTSSTGTFSTRDMGFAAAFGPAKGFATTIHFTDLLGLKTAPHQRLTVKQVSAGVDVFDGVIDYALLSSEQARIEGGRWPFSGGTLELLPATLNLDARQPRQFTFRVVGLDAAAFVNTLQLQNIDVHGTLDGLLPMIFDASGGRIENGSAGGAPAGPAAAGPLPPERICAGLRQCAAGRLGGLYRRRLECAARHDGQVRLRCAQALRVSLPCRAPRWRA